MIIICYPLLLDRWTDNSGVTDNKPHKLWPSFRNSLCKCPSELYLDLNCPLWHTDGILPMPYTFNHVVWPHDLVFMLPTSLVCTFSHPTCAWLHLISQNPHKYPLMSTSVRPSVRACVRACVRRQQFSLNDISSETTGPNLMKLCQNVPWVKLFQSCSNRSGPLHN